MTINIATIGACVTRDNFNTRFNPDYKDSFNLVYHQNQISMISLMSESIVIEKDENYEKLNDFGKTHLISEVDKRFFNIIREKKPQYLLIDFDADVNFGVVELVKGKYFTNAPKFKNLKMLDKPLKILKMSSNLEEYIKIWKESTDRFFNFMEKNVPDCQIILVKAKFVDELPDGSSISEKRNNANINVLDYKLLNLLWEYLNNYVETKYKFITIDMTKEHYYIDPSHPWGAYYLHYEQKYYRDFLYKLKKITKVI